MKNRLLIPLLLAASVVGCRTPHLAASFTGADGEVRLICLDPGHFHAALVQKYPNSRIDSTVWVYAPAGDEVQGYLDLIETFNAREKDPTHWQEKTYIGADYLEKMLAEQRGNVVLLAGNNGRKIDYIERSVGAVSYTHLDVYKRQQQDGALFTVFRTDFRGFGLNSLTAQSARFTVAFPACLQQQAA